MSNNECTDGSINHEWNDQDVCSTCKMTMDHFMSVPQEVRPVEGLVSLGETFEQREARLDRRRKSTR